MSPRILNLERKIQDHEKRIAQIKTDKAETMEMIRKEDHMYQKEELLKKRVGWSGLIFYTYYIGLMKNNEKLPAR